MSASGKRRGLKEGLRQDATDGKGGVGEEDGKGEKRREKDGKGG